MKIPGSLDLENAMRPSLVPETRNRLVIEVSVVLGIAIFAFIVRLAYLFQVQSIPLFSNLIADSLAYDQWAGRIASGDFLGEGFSTRRRYIHTFWGLSTILLATIFGTSEWFR